MILKLTTLLLWLRTTKLSISWFYISILRTFRILWFSNLMTVFMLFLEYVIIITLCFWHQTGCLSWLSSWTLLSIVFWNHHDTGCYLCGFLCFHISSRTPSCCICNSLTNHLFLYCSHSLLSSHSTCKLYNYFHSPSYYYN